MNLFKKKINLPRAVNYFIKSVSVDCIDTWPDIIACIKQNGFSIKNEDEGQGVWFTGIIALDTVQTLQVLDSNIANSIIESVDNYFDFRIEEMKDWPPILKEMYAFFCCIYFKYLKEYIINPVPQNAPSKFVSMAILSRIVLGFKGFTNYDSLPYNSPKTLELFDDFSKIASKSLGRWDCISNKYKVDWLF